MPKEKDDTLERMKELEKELLSLRENITEKEKELLSREQLLLEAQQELNTYRSKPSFITRYNTTDDLLEAAISTFAYKEGDTQTAKGKALRATSAAYLRGLYAIFNSREEVEQLCDLAVAMAGRDIFSNK